MNQRGQVPFIENAAYYIVNIFSFGILWIAKIVIKKAVIEATEK